MELLATGLTQRPGHAKLSSIVGRAAALGELFLKYCFPTHAICFA